MTPGLPVLCPQSKRRFERDCKEADRAQQYFEKMDADINVTKADVEKVRGPVSLLWSVLPRRPLRGLAPASSF